MRPTDATSGSRVGDLGDVHVGDDDRVEAGDLLGDEDALLEAAVRELQAGDDVADGPDAGDVGVQALVGEDEAAVHGDADLLVAEVRGRRAATDGDEQQVGLDRLAVLEGDDDAGLGLGDALEAHAELEVDAALAERALELLADRLVLVGDEVRQRLDDGDLGAPRAPDARELDADDAAAEDGDAAAARTSSASACSEVMTRPPISRPGSEREYEPVARTMFLPVTVMSPTWTVVGEVRRPSPSMVVMPRALMRPCRPLYLLATISSRYAGDRGDVDAVEGRW